MSVHLQNEIETLKKKILYLGAVAEEALRKSIQALNERNAVLAFSVIQGDVEVDRIEVELEEDCLKILALHQPVAVDLRFIVAVLKINNDLERIGDLAVNIAERVGYLALQEKFECSRDLSAMSEKVRWMVRRSLDALVNKDAAAAYEVCAADDLVDAMHRDMYGKIKAAILANPDQIESFINLLSVSRYLERIADQATNIGEDVVYLIEGNIVRHKTEDLQNQRKSSETDKRG